MIEEAKREHTTSSTEQLGGKLSFPSCRKGTAEESDQDKKASNGINVQITNKDSILNCLYLNARSLINKFDAFSATVSELEPDIIGVGLN